MKRVINGGSLIRYIFLSVFALLLLTACGENPTAPPNYPQISSNEAIALVHENLQSLQLASGNNCLNVFKAQVERYKEKTELPPEAFLPSAEAQGDGNWQVKWSVLVGASLDNIFAEPKLRNYQWMVYPITRTVMRTDNEESLPLIFNPDICP